MILYSSDKNHVNVYYTLLKPQRDKLNNPIKDKKIYETTTFYEWSTLTTSFAYWDNKFETLKFYVRYNWASQ